MAEWKYDLALVNTVSDKKIRDQPWYKERLKTRFIKSKKPNDISKTVVGSKWTFLQSGLDDFRDGLPPRLKENPIVKGSKTLEPNICGDSETKFPKVQSVNRGRFTKEEIAFQKTTPLQQQRRDHINEMEYGLLQHPLALFPHLEESMPPDVFEDVMDVLDPEMNLSSEIDEDEDQFDEEMTESLLGSQKNAGQSSITSKIDEEESPPPRNPYRWLPKKEDEQKDDRKNTKKRSESPGQGEHIKVVTKEFCEWVAGVGGESHNIEESTIHSLFASGYETKPALSVPIHVVELTNVPPELRMTATISQEETLTQTLEDVEKTQKKLYGQTGYSPSWVKMKYGAWYLDPKDWKRRGASEPLEDPQALKDKEMSDSKKKSLSMDEQLAPLHGSKSFKHFIEKKNTRMPEFLERVAEFQAQAAAEAEAAAKAADAGRDNSRRIRSGRTVSAS
ncbi:protein FAM47E-like [Anneissia japonica]|uniref:protein FAM47E-like n=1 Tax=Anneissia japonica TaxID=1529436 RepID=UPI0014254E13|nr:protein FAM47E-like [Anneissia japonica]